MKKHSHIWKILIFDMFIIEFGPVGVFFIAYYFSDFPTAALSLGIATLVALGLSKLVNKRVPWFAIFSGLVTFVVAMVTYFYTAPWVLVVKDSVYYSLFAVFLAVSMWRGRSVFRAFFGHIFALEAKGWHILQQRWLVFFVFAAVSNELVRIFLTIEQWVIYKQVVVILFLGFGLYQFRVSSRHRLPEADKLGLRRLHFESKKDEI